MADGGIDETIERGADSVALAIERIWYAFWPVLVPAATAAAAVAWFVHADRPATAVGLAVLVAAVIAWRHRTVTAALDAGRIRYRWSHAVLHAGAANPPPRRHRQHHDALGPRITRVERVPIGYRCTVKVGVGRGTTDELHARRDAIASKLSSRLRPVREVRVYQHPDGDASRCIATIVRRDPLASPVPTPWPLRDADRTSVSEPVPLGTTDEGAELRLDLDPVAGGHILVAGLTGSGKSVLVNLLVAHTALDPDAMLVLFDAKLVELAPWATCAEAFVETDVEHAVRELHGIRAVIDRRYQQIRADGEVSIRRGGETLTVVIDELAHYLTDRDHGAEFTAALRDILSRGRAAGVRVIAATQRPAAEIMDTTLRSQFVWGVALRVREPETVRMILACSPADAPAHEIKKGKAYAGIGYYVGEADRPTKFRAYYLDRADVKRIASRAAGNRIDHEREVTDLTIPPEWTLDEQAGPAEAEHAAAPDPILVADEPETDDDTIAAEILAILPLDESAGPTTRELEVLLPHSKRTWWPVFAGLRDDGRVASVAVNARGLLRHYRTGA